MLNTSIWLIAAAAGSALQANLAIQAATTEIPRNQRPFMRKLIYLKNGTYRQNTTCAIGQSITDKM